MRRSSDETLDFLLPGNEEKSFGRWKEQDGPFHVRRILHRRRPEKNRYCDSELHSVGNLDQLRQYLLLIRKGQALH